MAVSIPTTLRPLSPVIPATRPVLAAVARAVEGGLDQMQKQLQRLMAGEVPQHRDPELHAICAAFHRLDALLAAIPCSDEDAVSDAWDARQRVADRLARLRPGTTEARRAKAAVGVTLLLETANWERGPEWEFALAAFRAEA